MDVTQGWWPTPAITGDRELQARQYRWCCQQWPGGLHESWRCDLVGRPEGLGPWRFLFRDREDQVRFQLTWL